jgi:inner membrane protein
VHYESAAVLAAAAASILPDADHPGSWLGYRLGGISYDLERLFGHRSFLHSLLALLALTHGAGFAAVLDHGRA